MFYGGSQHEILPQNTNLTTFKKKFHTTNVLTGAWVKDETAVHIVHCT